MKVVIAGSSGLIGTRLVAALRSDDHQVVRLVRRPASAPDEFQWNPLSGIIDVGATDGADAVVNLCGAGIGNKRWSGAYKQEIRDSRIATTDVLANRVAAQGIPAFVSASGVNFYGDTGSAAVDESAPAGSGFLADLCADWEQAARPAAEAGARTVALRSAVVLSDHGGMLDRLRPLYKLGAGGRLGSGRQYFPWISVDDEIAAIMTAITQDSLSGPVNLVGPVPVTNAQFTVAMSRAVHRPAPWIVPGRALKLALGEMAEEAILCSTRAVPAALEAAGFEFRHKTIREALDAALGVASER